MLQVPLIRQNKEWVLERLKLRNFPEPGLIDEILRMDDQRKQLTGSYDELQGLRKSGSREVARLMKERDPEEAQKWKEKIGNWNRELESVSGELARSEETLENLLVRLPNLPHERVPPGMGAQDNRVVREAGSRPELGPDALPHWELAARYGLIDFELGNTLTGSGFPVFRGQGARLVRALISLFLDSNTGAGYTEYLPPLMVNGKSAFGTGQLPDKESQMYEVPVEGYYLIPTAEVPLTNLYRDQILEERDLPVRMTAYSPCFRREAGSYGREVKGLNRVHQFDKVEIVQLAHPDHSHSALSSMLEHVEKLLQLLELPYRVLLLCGADLGFASAMTFDLEVYSAAQRKWLEVSSVSHFGTYQSNRMKIRFRDGTGKTHLVHTLNASSLALPRIIAALLENNQSSGGILLPGILHPYFGNSRIG